MENQVKRETLGSRLGFIMLSAGCAIGIGNVWKFPWMVGQYGGGAFVLIYLVCLIILGVPVMTMEFSLGRASRKSVVKMYQPLEKPKSKWHIHGYFAMAGNYILMMFYTVVTGWMLQYFVDMASGKFVGTDKAGIDRIYEDMLANPTRLTIYMAIVVLIGIGVCSIGVQKGVERITKVMMIALIVIMVVLAVNSVFLEGGQEGLKFYLIPNFETMAKIGVVDVIVAAMNQAFFTLSLGMGCMAIFGSYVKKDRSLMGESINVAVLDTFVAFTSGLIIFPACFAYGVEVDNGRSLIFKTLPNIFNNIPLGRLWGSLFFIFMSFAALSTIITVFETLISCTMDLFNWSRKKACALNGIALFVLSIPCVLGFNLWSGFKPFGAGSNVMDIEDFAVNNILLPVGSIIFVLFCTSRFGWGWDNFTKEANEGKGLKVAKWMRGYMTFVLPVIILVIFILGLISYFS